MYTIHFYYKYGQTLRLGTLKRNKRGVAQRTAQRLVKLGHKGVSITKAIEIKF